MQSLPIATQQGRQACCSMQRMQQQHRQPGRLAAQHLQQRRQVCQIHRRCKPLACSASATGAVTAGNGSFVEDVNVVNYEGGAYTVRGNVQTPVPADEVFELLADYANLPSVFSNIAESHMSTEQQPMQLLQICRWQFLAFSGTFRTLLSVQEDRQAGRLVFSLIKSPFMRDFLGSWQLTPSPDGGCKIQHTLKVEPILDAPAFFSSYTKRIFVQQVTKILEDLTAALQQRS